MLDETIARQQEILAYIEKMKKKKKKKVNKQHIFKHYFLKIKHT